MYSYSKGGVGLVGSYGRSTDVRQARCGPAIMCGRRLLGTRRILVVDKVVDINSCFFVMRSLLFIPSLKKNIVWHSTTSIRTKTESWGKYQYEILRSNEFSLVQPNSVQYVTDYV